MGIAPELLPRVFDLFTQGSRSLDRTQGGSARPHAVRRLAQLHGGTVTAVSKGSGRARRSRCGFRAPSRQCRRRSPPPLPPGTRPLRILLVEDNPDGARRSP